MSRKILSLILSFGLLFQQIGFAQVALELNLASYLSRIGYNSLSDKFRPIHLRYFSYDSLNDSFKLLVDKGDIEKGLSPSKLSGSILKGTVPEDTLKQETQILLSYFLVGVTLPDEMFWVNLRPDSEDQIIDQYLEKTDVGKIMLEADLQLKKDTALFTSPNTPEGREYWDRLYKKAEELYGYESVAIPTLTRPWIVPGEIIVRESKDSAYVYKATLKVMLEQDYLQASSSKLQALSLSQYSFKDERSKALNEYSSQLIRELIIPKLTKEVNSSKRYSNLRQVYYSLILSRWFKLRFKGLSPSKLSGSTLKGTAPAFTSLIDAKDLTNLISQESWSKTDYFKQYRKSFAEGEYNIKEPIYTPTGQVIRSYFSGGLNLASSAINSQNGIIGKELTINKLSRLGIMIEGDFLQAVSSPILKDKYINENPARAAGMLAKEIGLLGMDLDPELIEKWTKDIVLALVMAFRLECRRDPTPEETKSFFSRIKDIPSADDSGISDFTKTYVEAFKFIEEVKAQIQAKAPTGIAGVIKRIYKVPNPHIVPRSKKLFPSGGTSPISEPQAPSSDVDKSLMSVTSAKEFLNGLPGIEVIVWPENLVFKEKGGFADFGENNAGPELIIFEKNGDNFRFILPALTGVTAEFVLTYVLRVLQNNSPVGHKDNIEKIRNKLKELGNDSIAASSAVQTLAPKLELLGQVYALNSKLYPLMPFTKQNDAAKKRLELIKDNSQLNLYLWVSRGKDNKYRILLSLRELRKLERDVLSTAVEQKITAAEYAKAWLLAQEWFDTQKSGKTFNSEELLVGSVVRYLNNKRIFDASLREKIKAFLPQEKNNKGIFVRLAKVTEINSVIDKASSAITAVAVAKKALELDEGDDYFIKPTIVEPDTNIKERDSVIFFNFRGDRMEPMFRLLTGDPDFRHFPLKDLHLVVAPFAVYNDKYFNKYGFKSVVREAPVSLTLGEVIAKAGKTQGRVAESEKFKHVTWFFDGLRELEFEGMDSVLIPSNKIDRHWKKPEMKAAEIAQEAIKWISGEEGNKKDFIVINFANEDILGHFDNLEAIIKGALVVDEALGLIREAVKKAGGVLVVTADHGSAEQKAKLDGRGLPILDSEGKPKPHKAHSFDNKVPFIIEGIGDAKLNQVGSLQNVAPTILDIMGIPKPQEMTADSLLEGYSGKSLTGPVVLVIRDGWGKSKFSNPEALQFNAIYQAGLRAEAAGIKFNDAEIMTQNPNTELWSHGEYVGHPGYQMGDSENGHMNIGAGRRVDSTLFTLDNMLKSGEFAESKIVREAIDNAKDKHTLHLIGMISEGGVHSHKEHVKKLLKVIADNREGLRRVVFHPIFDGRDIETSEKPGWRDLEEIIQVIKELGLDDIVKIGVESGRFYPMDRDALNNDKQGKSSAELWLERVKPWYDAIVEGRGRQIVLEPEAQNLASSSKFQASSSEGAASPITKEEAIAALEFSNQDRESNDLFKFMPLKLEKTTAASPIDQNFIEAEVHYNLGLIFVSIFGKLDDAIDEFQKAISKKPDYVEAHNHLGVVLNLKGKFKEAIAVYKEATRINPNYAEARNNLGLTLLNLGETKEAIAEFLKAINIKPDYAEARNNLGRALFKSGKAEEAIDEFVMAINIKPNFIEARYNMSVVLLNSGEYSEAIDALNEAININSNYAEAYLLLGLAYYLGFNNRDLAAKNIKMALDLQPKLLDFVSQKTREKVGEIMRSVDSANKNPGEKPTSSGGASSAVEKEDVRSALTSFLDRKDQAYSQNVYETLEIGDIVTFVKLPDQEEIRLVFINESKNYLKSYGYIPQVLLTPTLQDSVGQGIIYSQDRDSFGLITIGNFSPALGDAQNYDSHASVSKGVIIKRDDVVKGNIFLAKQPIQQGDFTLRIGEKILVNSKGLSEVLHSNLKIILRSDLPEWVQGTAFSYGFGGYEILYTVPIHTKEDFYRGHVMPLGIQQIGILKELGYLRKISAASPLTTQEHATSNPAFVDSSLEEKPLGGIDFRALPANIQPIGSFNGLNFKLPQLSQSQLEQINVDLELQQIKNMVKAGNIPSGERIKELIAACAQKGRINSQIDSLLLCIVDTLKLEEENALESSPELREALVIVDSIS